MRTTVIVGCLFLATLVSLYCAAAGWVNVEVRTALQQNSTTEIAQPVIVDGVQFKNMSALRRYEVANKARTWFPWAEELPDAVSLMLTSIAFGSVGGVIRVAFDAVNGTRVLDGRSFGLVALSGLFGLLILGVSYVIPAALTVSEVTVRPVALLFFCLLGGVFFDHVFLWLRSAVEKKFPTKS